MQVTLVIMKGLGAIFVTLAVFAANVAAAPSNNAPRYPHQPMEISAQVHKRVMCECASLVEDFERRS